VDDREFAETLLTKSLNRTPSESEIDEAIYSLILFGEALALYLEQISTTDFEPPVCEVLSNTSHTSQ